MRFCWDRVVTFGTPQELMVAWTLAAMLIGTGLMQHWLSVAGAWSTLDWPRPASIFAASGAEASAYREVLKSVGRGGAGRGWRPPNLAGKTDAQLRASAGKTNLGINAYGAGVATAGGTQATQCGCSK
jgi:hypothetical protein